MFRVLILALFLSFDYTCAFLKNPCINKYYKNNKSKRSYNRRNGQRLVSLPRSSLNKIRMTSPEDIIKLAKTVRGSNNYDIWSYSEFVNNLKDIDSAAIVDNQHLILFSEKVKQLSEGIDDSVIGTSHLHLLKYIPSTIDRIVDTLTKKGVDYQVFDIPLPEPIQIPILLQIIALYIIFNTFLVFMGRGGLSPGSGMNPFNAGRKPVNFIEKGQVSTNFEDVAGLDEAKEELGEIVDYLKNPFKYTFAGAKIPKGVLLEGPPGTGKTLLARAVAGEADVSFISASGSEFIEMFVGVGAKRVRALFEQAMENKPCVIFIDEIDAVGGRRGYGFNSGGNDEREQTLNQILTNMDGFEKSEGIIVLAATNRADTLDPALKRSGRFDRKINVNLPDFFGRKAIANVHFKNKPNVTLNYDNLARLTQGFSGADLATLANEATLLGVRSNMTNIDDSLVFRAFEKMTIGLPKKYDSRSLYEKRLVAVHETGHAMMVQYFSEYFKLQSVTINANTNGAGGYTLFTPNEYYSGFPTRGFYLARIIVALGGRAAEIVYFRTIAKKKTTTNFPEFDEFEDLDVTSGASGDINQANEIIKEYLVIFENYVTENENRPVSENTKSYIDHKIKNLIIECTDKAVKIIENDLDKFNLMSQKLLKENTINY